MSSVVLEEIILTVYSVDAKSSVKVGIRELVLLCHTDDSIYILLVAVAVIIDLVTALIRI